MEPLIPIELLMPQDVKKILNCSLPQVYKLADRGLLTCVRIPGATEAGGRGLVRFKLEDILKFIDDNTKPGKG